MNRHFSRPLFQALRALSPATLSLALVGTYSWLILYLCTLLQAEMYGDM